MSSFESLLLTQTEKQLSALQDQSQVYSQWLKQESELIDTTIAQQNFNGELIQDVWEIANFYIIDEICEVRSKWNAIILHHSEGLSIANRIVRCKKPITLKSLAAEIRLDVRLAVNSEIWVFTRGSSIYDSTSAIIRISKESEIDGVFIAFGSPIGSSSEFIFFKRQQIPEEKYNPDEDFTDLNIKIKDNGDDRIYVSIKLSTLESTVFQTFCSKFIPSLLDSQVMVAGNGKTVMLRSLAIQQKERSSMGIIIEASKRQQCCLII